MLTYMSGLIQGFRKEELSERLLHMKLLLAISMYFLFSNSSFVSFFCRVSSGNPNPSPPRHWSGLFEFLSPATALKMVSFCVDYQFVIAVRQAGIFFFCNLLPVQYNELCLCQFHSRGFSYIIHMWTTAC